MKLALAILTGVAFAALLVMSVAPTALVGMRAGFDSLAGLTTAVALAAITLVGGWLWIRDRRARKGAGGSQR
ncbi:hypothetical protein [Maritimibacter sp. DP1N21-5]|uniref:hypothetical protein n=1 Tax=Maritimibacter sp. DP1N21-5 TaxID=2836867 RepID=UPI001C48ED79|nr:hypothetical protein [Maritimibacter sp. DP1N21-5]MBV7409067.1 hypothetical protein [Maritimibacter sp. DP1N21-5]